MVVRTAWSLLGGMGGSRGDHGSVARWMSAEWQSFSVSLARSLFAWPLVIRLPLC